METRANFVLIGAFTLAAVIGAFAVPHVDRRLRLDRRHRHYQVVFSGSVYGLSVGSNVLFNGLKVGEVTNLGFVKDNPSQVIADIDVTNASAPINANTKAQLETHGADRHRRRGAEGRRGEGRGRADRQARPSSRRCRPRRSPTCRPRRATCSTSPTSSWSTTRRRIHQTVENAQVFSMALAHNAGRVDEALASIADLGKTIEPLANKAQVLSQDADTLIKSIDAAKVNEVIANAQTFSKALANSSGNTEAVLRDGAAFIKKLNEASAKLDFGDRRHRRDRQGGRSRQGGRRRQFRQRRRQHGPAEPRQHRRDAQERGRDLRQAQRIRPTSSTG